MIWLKFSMRRLLTVTRDARILGVDALESVSMIMAGILYEIGLTRKIKSYLVIIFCISRDSHEIGN